MRQEPSRRFGQKASNFAHVAAPFSLVVEEDVIPAFEWDEARVWDVRSYLAVVVERRCGVSAAVEAMLDNPS